MGLDPASYSEGKLFAPQTATNLSGDPRTPKGVDVDGVYFDGSKGYGPEK